MSAISTTDPNPRGWALFGRFDWSAIIVSVFVGLALTMLLLAFGGAAGIEAADGASAGTIGAAFGTWAVISALIGTLVGTFIGGRFSHWRTGGSAVYHGITAWSVVLVLSALLGSFGVVGLVGSALQQDAVVVQAQQAQGQQAQANQEEAAEAISWGGWALALGLLLTMLVSIGGWWLGSRTSLSEFEAGDSATSYGGGTTGGTRITT